MKITSITSEEYRWPRRVPIRNGKHVYTHSGLSMVKIETDDGITGIGLGAGGEIQLTDGIAALLSEEPVYAYRFAGKRYDCGSKLGYLEATVEFGLKHPSLGPGFSEYLRSLAGRL